MKNSTLVISLLLLISFSCGNTSTIRKINVEILNPAGTTIETRFNPPEGYMRKNTNTGSFEGYLRRLPLRPDGSTVKYYDGSEKPNRGVYAAVIDFDPGAKNLMQCADAVIRLRAQYLYQTNQKNRIAFNLTNGFRVSYSKWMEGYRVKVTGNHTEWVKTADPGDNEIVFEKYLEFVYNYAGTLSLSKELISVPFDSLDIGDVLIIGGSPGHAEIVVDVAESSDGKDKVFLLAQGYMPAQDIQVLLNPVDEKISPWYRLSIPGEGVETPEYSFRKTDLKRFQK